MAIISGGGTTTAQVVASGKVLPVAKSSGVIVDTTTYDDPVSGSGKLTTLVFPAGTGTALAVAVAGDAFPRWLLVSNAIDGLFLGDGTNDLYNTGVASLAVNGWTDHLAAGGPLQIGSATDGSEAAQMAQISPRFGITSGALPTVQLVTATGAQILTTRDTETITPCTFNPGAATTATVTVALSPDNVTYSTLGVETVPAGVALDGTIHLVKVRVPAGWYLKLTVNAQAVLGLTTYY